LIKEKTERFIMTDPVAKKPINTSQYQAQLNSIKKFPNTHKNLKTLVNKNGEKVIMYNSTGRLASRTADVYDKNGDYKKKCTEFYPEGRSATTDYSTMTDYFEGKNGQTFEVFDNMTNKFKAFLGDKLKIKADTIAAQ